MKRPATCESSETPPPKRARLTYAEALEQTRRKEFQDVQLELHQLEQRCADEQIQVQFKYDKLRVQHFEKRASLLKQIPGFWMSAFKGHPAKLIHEQELPALEHLENVQVNDNLDRFGSFEVIFSFGAGSLFQEKTVKKKTTFNEDQGEVLEPGVLTAIGAAGSAVLKGVAAAKPTSSVLAWLLDGKANPGRLEEDVGERLRRDIWQDPVPYFLADHDTQSTSNGNA